MAAQWRVFLACMLICVLYDRALAAELPFELANARNGPLKATFVLAKAPAGWTRELRIGLAAGVTAATTAGLELDDVLLETEAGVQVTAIVSRALGLFPAQLTAGQTATVTMLATFSARGLYRGELLLRQGEQRRVVTLEVNVMEPGTTPIEVEGGHSFVITGPCFGSEKINAVLQLRNKGHDVVAMKGVELASATRVDKPVSPGIPVQNSTARLSAQGSGVAIEPGAVARVPIEISGLDEPGIYLVNVAVQAETYEPELVTVTVYRRKPWMWALFWIATGALAAWGTRAFTSGGEDRLKLRRRLALARDRLRALRHQVVEPEHEAVAARLSSELEVHERELRWASIKESEGVVESIEERVELLNDILAAARQVGRLDNERRLAPRKALSAALAKVRVQSSKEDVKKERNAVAALAPDEIFRSQLVAALDELNTQLSSQLARGSDALQAAIATQVQPLQASAYKLLRQEQLDRAADDITDAHTLLRKLLANELKRQVAGASPPWVQKARWAFLQTTITALLPNETDAPTWKTFQQAQREYFHAVVEGLAHYAKEKADSQDMQASDANRCREIAAELTSLLSSGDAGLDAAAALYHRRLHEIAEASTPAVSRMQIKARPDSEDRSQEGGWSWTSLLLSETPPRGKPASPPPPPTVRDIEWRYRCTSLLVHAVVLLVALASGMKALWIGNPTWGTDDAWLIAFLWGAGVGAVGDAFTGIVGLRQRLGLAQP
jgi:hypothetical protein